MNSGASLFQLNYMTGNSVYWRGTGFVNGNAVGNNGTGMSVFGTPALYSDDTGVTLVMNVKPYPTPPGNFTPNTHQVQSGTSLVFAFFSATNFSGVTHNNNLAINLDYWFAEQNYRRRGSSFIEYAESGNTFWSPHLLVDTDDTGTTVYGTSGISIFSGASIWAVSLGNVVGGQRLNSNQYSGGLNNNSAVSGFWSAPVISGNSLFILGQYKSAGGGISRSGVSILMFDKRRLDRGPNIIRTMLQNPASANTPIATPVISGDSLFVVDAVGGLTAYSISTTNQLPAAAAAGDFVQLGTATSSVTASPVADSDFLAVAVNHLVGANNVAGVTVFRIDSARLTGPSSVSWWYEFPAGTTIVATPAISNGRLWVAVNQNQTGAQIARFNLDRQGTTGRLTAPDEAFTTDANGIAFGFVGHASPIIIGERVIFIAYHPTGAKRLHVIDAGDTARGESFWNQFKFDATRTGDNTRPLIPTLILEDDDGVCFISTIK
jgi:hypothetical protein